jgi:xanthine dehydrogenase/oxidase
LNNLKWFAGRQIRSVGTLAGNIVNASPISDLNPVLLAAGATLTVASAQRGKRTIPIEQFFLGYRRTALAPDEVLVSVHLPFTQPGEHIRAYKQARRKDDDIAIVNAGMRVQVSPIQGGYQITKCVLAYGGMAPTTVIAQHTSQTLVGVQLGDRAAFDAAINLLLQKVSPT